MPFLQLGSLVLEVQSANADHSEGDVVGEENRSASGRLVSSVSLVKRRWRILLKPMTAAYWNTNIRPLHRTFVVATGDALDSFSGGTVRVLALDYALISDGNVGELRVPQLTLDEA